MIMFLLYVSGFNDTSFDMFMHVLFVIVPAVLLGLYWDTGTACDLRTFVGAGVTVVFDEAICRR